MTSATRFRGLFRKYLLLILILVTAVLVTSTGSSVYSSFQANQQALLRLETQEASAAADNIERFVTQAERQIQLITENEPSLDADALSVEFSRLLRQVLAITDVSYLDFAGREQLRVSRLDLDVIGSQKDYSGDPRFLEAKSRRIYFGPVYFREESEPYMTVAMAGDGADAGVTVAEVNLKFIWEVISRIRVGKAGHAYVVDPSGTLVAHPNIS